MIDTKRIDTSVVLLIVANLIPLIGVLFLGWDIFQILIFFWAESFVIGFYNILKMIKAPAPEPNKLGGIIEKIFLIPFFIVHYGGFMFGHLLFIIVFFLSKVQSSIILTNSSIQQPTTDLIASGITTALNPLFSQLGWALGALFISHGISYYQNYLQKGEYKKTSTAELFVAPYGRIIFMHLIIIGGAFVIILTDASKYLIIPFIIGKIIFDISAHQRQHSGIQGRANIKDPKKTQ